MKKLSKKIGRNKIIQSVPDNIDKIMRPSSVTKSWKNAINYVEGNEEVGTKGFRTPQIGAIFAIRSHWTTTSKTATVVMPTGTGKTETMIASLISEGIEKTLIVVPSKMLRDQTVKKCMSLGILKEVNVVKKTTKHPIIACISTTPKELDELKLLIESSNIIVSTMSLLKGFDKEYIRMLQEECSTLFIDEAHHIQAKTWNKFKSNFKNNRCIQFTATPFRNDGKKMDGKIIYNFPLVKAQEQKYFKPLQFHAIYEFDELKSDLVIANTSVELLKQDISKGLKHLLLVRANSRGRAKDLYHNIYNKHFKELKPVLVITGIGEKDKREALEKVRNLESRIVVCVDMFGEGIDIPNLKIAAIHDKYKSLPITLQFIGRFTRNKKGLGDAKIVANIANDDVKDSLRELYAQDADWNILLHSMSDKAIDREIHLQELAQGFSGTGIDEINIKQIVPKVSMVPFETTNKKWNWEQWTKVFDENKCKYYINEEEKVLIIAEMDESKVDWSKYRGINNITWQLHVVYWNESKKMFYINSTKKPIVSKLADAIFSQNHRITGESIFKCLHGVNRLMLSTVGLNSAIDGPIRYKMFAGIDISQGISESNKENCIKSNLFGVGYDGKGKVSIGCSYKGTIWARWVENIDYWMNWCNEIGDKITSSDIDVKSILEGALIPEVINEIPKVVPYRIDWPIDIGIRNDQKLYFSNFFSSYPIYCVEIGLLSNSIDDRIKFYIGNDEFREEFELLFENGNYNIKMLKSAGIEVQFGKDKYSVVDFFREYPPTIKFVDQSSLEGNLYITIKENNTSFDSKKVDIWDWNGVDINKESQGLNKEKDSIQYRVIQELLKDNDYEIIFDDDNAGEIADIVAIKAKNDKIMFEFYHCKYAHGNKPGARVADLYEVCGQAEKSVSWMQDTMNIIDRMIKRENDRQKRNKVTRFERGNLRKLNELKNRLRVYPSSIDVFIVQPGVKYDVITSNMERLLCGTSTYLMDTYSLKLRLICS